ncbi:MAG: TMEM165/GDT1 family protein, partial [Clostridia bacterium]|nr:TMEM165/GDT1 family protein [Clostridia bacterium]
MSLFLSVLAMVFIAEMGDKTQFLMIAMASKYKIRDILIGVAAAILVLNAFAIGLGLLIGNVLPTSI